MKVEPVRGPKFAALVKKYGNGTPSFATPVLNGCEPNDPLAILLTNYLLWESTPALVEEALGRIARTVVDVNDLRVMLELGGVGHLALEVNVDPPNEGSLRFHERLGFVEVGQQDTPYGIRVSMQMRPVSRPT